VYNAITDEMLARSTRDPEALALLRTIGMRAALLVPIKVRDQILGVMALVAAETARTYEPGDVALAEELGRRAGIALENARLYAVAQEAAARAEESARTAEQASRAKDEFLATVSHELRTPLNAIYGWATILRKVASEPLKLQHGLEVIERNAKAQTRIVNDILDLSRIISGKLQLKVVKTDLSTVIHQAADVVRPGADSKGIKLAVEVDPDIGAAMADPDRLHQIMWNLLINAVRFTPRGGSITVTGDRTDSGIVLHVIDTGAGIAPHHLPHIFERFTQVDCSTTRSHSGLGLGLAIVRHLVEAHGGTVDAQSAGLGQGSIFSVSLPICAVNTAREEEEEVQAEEESSRASTVTSLTGARVLVVDDEADAVELLRVILEEAGAAVVQARSAREALAALDSAGPFTVVLSDIGMPDMDGYAFMRHIRSRDSGADVPAIALTAYARPQDSDLARRAGYQEHLAKPVDQARLLEAVKMWSQVRMRQTAL